MEKIRKELRGDLSWASYETIDVDDEDMEGFIFPPDVEPEERIAYRQSETSLYI